VFRVLFLMILVTGCASLDRYDYTEFEPLDGGFRYVAISDFVYSLNGANAEAVRMEWLEKYLADNGVCPDGYTLTDRKAVLVNDWVGEGTHKIYYQGECK
jgi:hypothetical protein